MMSSASRRCTGRGAMTESDRERIRLLIEESRNVLAESRRNSKAREKFLEDTRRELEEPLRVLRKIGYIQ